MTLTIYYTDKTSEQFKIINLEWSQGYMNFWLENGDSCVVGLSEIVEFNVDKD